MEDLTIFGLQKVCDKANYTKYIYDFRNQEEDEYGILPHAVLEFNKIRTTVCPNSIHLLSGSNVFSLDRVKRVQMESSYDGSSVFTVQCGVEPNTRIYTLIAK